MRAALRGLERCSTSSSRWSTANRSTRRRTSRRWSTRSATSSGGRSRQASTSSTTARWASRTGSPTCTSASPGSSRGSCPLEGGTILPPSRDRQAFPEFYAEHDAEFARRGCEPGARHLDRGGGARGARQARSVGQAVVLHRADRVRLHGARAGHRSPQGCARRCRGGRRVPPGRGAGERLLAEQRVLRDATRSSSSQSPTPCTRSTRGSSRRASCSRSTTPC